MKVVFQEKEIGYICVKHVGYDFDGCHECEDIFDSEMEDIDKTMWAGSERMVWTLDSTFLKIEGFNPEGVLLCTNIIPTHRIIELYSSKDKPLEKTALTDRELEMAK